VLDVTAALVAYPPVPTFVDLMREFSAVIDSEAAAMAARPVPGLPRSVSVNTSAAERGAQATSAAGRGGITTSAAERGARQKEKVPQ